MRHRPSISALAAFCFVAGGVVASAAPTASPEQIAASELSGRVERIVATRIPSVSVAIAVRALPDGEVLFERRSGTPHILASNTKLLTSAAALDSLGGDAFATRVYATGTLDYFGNLDGDILISGTGDSALSGKLSSGDMASVVEDWIGSIRKLGLHSVMGNIVVDHTFRPELSDRLGGGAIEDMAPPVAEIDDEDDDDTEAVILLISPGPAAGKRADLGIRPAGSSLKVINSCYTVPGPTREVRISRTSSGTVLVNGKIGVGAGVVTHILATGDPSLHAASLLRDALPRQGIPVLGDVTLGTPSKVEGARLLAETRADLIATLHLCNKASHNQTAEEMLRIMGARSPESRKLGTVNAGRKVVRSFLEEEGLAPASFSIGDGSGLSRENRMSPESLTKLLVAMSRKDHFARYKESMAHPGEEGSTLAHRLFTVSRFGSIAAKTGHIRGVNTLSGYLDTAKGRYVFSVLTNGTSARAGNDVVDDLVIQIASALAVADGSVGAAEAAGPPTAPQKVVKSKKASSPRKKSAASSKRGKSSGKRRR